jgi:hypothetical protein
LRTTNFLPLPGRRSGQFGRLGAPLLPP